MLHSPAPRLLKTPLPSVFLGLGSNINPEQNLRAAADLIRKHWPSARFSSVYHSKAREVETQEDFLNAVAVIETDESPDSITDRLHTIERALKKSPPFRFGPRTIDLDLLLNGDRVIETPTLTVPHPRMHERRFVLEPLCELIDLQQRHPLIDQTWTELLQNVKDQNCDKTALEL